MLQNILYGNRNNNNNNNIVMIIALAYVSQNTQTKGHHVCVCGYNKEDYIHSCLNRCFVLFFEKCVTVCRKSVMSDGRNNNHNNDRMEKIIIIIINRREVLRYLFIH